MSRYFVILANQAEVRWEKYKIKNLYFLLTYSNTGQVTFSHDELIESLHKGKLTS